MAGSNANVISNEIIRKLSIMARQRDETTPAFLYRLMRAIANETICPEKKWNELSMAAQQWYNDAVDEYKSTGRITGFPETPYLPSFKSKRELPKFKDSIYFFQYEKTAADRGISEFLRNLCLLRPYLSIKELRDELEKRFQVKCSPQMAHVVVSNARATVRILWEMGVINESDLVRMIVPKGQPDSLGCLADGSNMPPEAPEPPDTTES